MKLYDGGATGTRDDRYASSGASDRKVSTSRSVSCLRKTRRRTESHPCFSVGGVTRWFCSPNYYHGFDPLLLTRDTHSSTPRVLVPRHAPFTSGLLLPKKGKDLCGPYKGCDPGNVDTEGRGR